MDNLTLADKLHNLNDQDITRYVLVSTNFTQIPVSSNVLEYPSLRARCKVVDGICYVHTGADSLEDLLVLYQIVEGKSVFSSMMERFSFLSSLADEKLENGYISLWRNIRYTSIHEFGNEEIECVFPDQTNECPDLPINLLLTNPSTIKVALGSSHIYKCNFNVLRGAMYWLYNEEEANPGRTWFTNEFDNLPAYQGDYSVIAPYKVGFGGDSKIVKSRHTQYKLIKYDHVKSRIRDDIRKDNILSTIIRERYVVLFGPSISAWLHSGLYNNVHLCAKDEDSLSKVLSYFPNAEVTRKGNLVRLSEVNTYYKIYVPEAGYKHFVASQAYSIDRCYYDGNEIYMTASCMLSIVNGRLMYIRPKLCKVSEVNQYLNVGFRFLECQLLKVEGIEEIKYKTIKARTEYDDDSSNEDFVEINTPISSLLYK